jgi:type IV pilus assembly protein PilN
VIKVNLLASTPGAKPARVWIPREQRSAALGLGMLMLTAMVVGGWWYYLSSVRADVTHRIAAADAELLRLKAAAKLVERVNARKTELTQRLAVIERLQGAKRAPVTLLETLSRNLPDGLWLMEVKQVGTAVQVEGRALSLTAVTDFAEGIQNSGVFERPVEILTTTTEAVEETTVVRFSVKGELATASSPASAAQPPAPASVASAAMPRAGV